jgi:2-oxoglutarate dehydrogenase E2 component (dihydrolipoamide succinyltransferase)
MENMSIDLKVPAVGESITEVEIGEWRKKPGERVEKDEVLAILDTEKASVDFPSPEAGVISQLLKNAGETAAVGESIAILEPSAGAPSAPQKAPPEKPAEPVSSSTPKAGAKPAVEAVKSKTTPRGKAELKPVIVEQRPEPVVDNRAGAGSPKPIPVPREPAPSVSEMPSKPEAEPTPATPESQGAPNRREEVVRMSRLRKTVARRLVEAQRDAALLTTFNECDMSAVVALRKTQGEAFQQRHGVKLGFMSFFVKAVVDALKQSPALNAEIRGEEIIYRYYFDIGIAIGSGRGLVVPVLKNAEALGFAGIEKAIADFGARARENKLAPEELQGGTFTISNGGVYGSLLSTPIVNPPQSGVLGMHAIKERPIAENGVVVIRPMMYLALTYDHRIVDGREAVTFLKRIKEVVEDPCRMLLEA